jgi:hypothetical protein
MLSSLGGNPTKEVSLKKVKVPKQICIISSLAIAINYGFPFSMIKSTYHGKMIMLR